MLKPGDKVRVINDFGVGYLKNGEVHTVKKVHNDYVYLEGVELGWHPSRFKKVEGAENLSDQELANKYRDLRRHMEEARNELLERGYIIQIGNNVIRRQPVLDIKIFKQIREEL